MQRAWFHYTCWEEYHFGMWSRIDGEQRDNLLRKAVEFTGDAKLYGKYMFKVVKQWPYSALQNLTNTSINRRAWIGHAACCIALSCPEDITRYAWHELTQEQQDKANAKADKAIELFEKQYEKGIQLCLRLV